MDLANVHGLRVRTAPTIAIQVLLQQLLASKIWLPSGNVCCGPAAAEGSSPATALALPVASGS
jgi:hypothetical protein